MNYVITISFWFINLVLSNYMYVSKTTISHIKETLKKSLEEVLKDVMLISVKRRVLV